MDDGADHNTIAAELAGQHPTDEVRRMLMRLVVTDRIMDVGGKYGLGPAEGADQEPG